MFLSLTRTPAGWQGTGMGSQWHLRCLGVATPFDDATLAGWLSRWRADPLTVWGVDLIDEHGVNRGECFLG